MRPQSRDPRPLALTYVSDPMTRDMARLSLRAEGYVVQAAASRDDVDVERPSLLIVDEASLVTIPESLGAPTVVLLSQATDMTAEEAHEVSHIHSAAGAAVHFLPSPFSPLELVRAARRVRRMNRDRGMMMSAPLRHAVANA